MFGHGQLSLFVVLLSCSLANSADAPQLALHTSHSQTQLRLRNRFAVETPACRTESEDSDEVEEQHGAVQSQAPVGHVAVQATNTPASAALPDKRLRLLMGDLVAAVGAALCATPLAMTVDVAVTKASSGDATVAQALFDGLSSLVTEPLTLIRSPTYKLVLFVALCTYASANLARAVCELYLDISPALPVLVCSTGANMMSSIYKDVRIAQILGKSVSSRPFPLSGYVFFLLRDVLANAGGFVFPLLLQPHLPQRMIGASAETMAQLLVPTMIQVVTSPLHLLGLLMYNSPDFSASQHFAAVAAVYVSVTSSRLIKGFCTYGLGGVSNIKIRAAIGSHNHEQSRD